ncbi:MAG: hypothetical protein LUC91_11595 [Prevotella sp.]|nr:hypothetical protein [Prevotella sp.]
MKKEDIQSFIKFFVRQKGLTKEQKAKRDYLLARDADVNVEVPGDDEEDVFTPLSVLKTAQFLSKFNDPMGLKYLTHDFDNIDDGRPRTIEDLLKVVTKILDAEDLPKSLWSLINGYINTESWVDTYGNEHTSCINNPEWVSWSKNNNLHPINNSVFEKEIMAFRSTVRLVAPSLNSICDEAKEGLSISIIKDKIDNADFYTNTYILYMVLKKVFKMMEQRAKQYPDISISFKRSTDPDGRMLRHIIITQSLSFADKTIEEVMNRLENNPEAGDFGSIRKLINGYCYWQVESLWDGEPYRWNILKTSDMAEKEEMDKKDVKGFTHIFTYYLL